MAADADPASIGSRARDGTIAWFRTQLVRWFAQHGRTFPWRQTKEPYDVLVAELMLRRTKSSQVEPVYGPFLKRYPDAATLAGSDPDDIMQVIGSLGLRGRAVELVRLGMELTNRFDGEVPRTREELKDLTGVGDYVAGAVLAMAFNRPEWIVDTNVVRVFRRFYGLPVRGEGRRLKSMVEIARQFADCRSPRSANLALLDLAALVCRPTKPLCESCPVRSHCSMYAAGRPTSI